MCFITFVLNLFHYFIILAILDCLTFEYIFLYFGEGGNKSRPVISEGYALFMIRYNYFL